ncbi:hypothetical protein C6P46_000633 [Rhodotorula mucilaginosa]|uniref:Non-structural maintenance of chromosomes element 1 homolog n=1 Tax=Rhodotorula mucilaginosa TaxID=5537 RepID=A0A9P6W7Y4_RHOMI|nr:hypothetical protein C6P46_000633 [Rhodotorula mucilaginosa]
MAPRASASNGRRRAAADSDDDDDRRQPVAGSSKQRQKNQANGIQAAYDAELDALELDHPDKTLRHLFLQTLMSRKVIPLDTARELYKHCVKLCKVKHPDAFETFVAELEPGLSLCGLDIKTTRDQDSGASFIALVNTIEDEVAKLATDYKAEEIAFFRAVVDKIMTARKLAYSTPSDEAVRLAKAPITKANAMQLLTSFLANGWLSLHSSGRLMLSPRSLLELAPYLRETFSQGEDPNDEDAPECEQERTIVDCNLCMSIVTSGYACPNKDCGIRLHTFCVAQRLGQDGRCPARLDPNNANACQQIWPRDPTTRKFYGTVVGVLAFEEAGDDNDDDDDDDDEDDNDMSSMAAGSSAVKGKKRKATTSASASGKGKGGGRKKAAAPKKKRSRANEDEDEDEEDELEDDDDEDASSSAYGGRGGGAGSSPAARRKRSSRAAAAAGTRADDSAADDDEE